MNRNCARGFIDTIDLAQVYTLLTTVTWTSSTMKVFGARRLTRIKRATWTGRNPRPGLAFCMLSQTVVAGDVGASRKDGNPLMTDAAAGGACEVGWTWLSAKTIRGRMKLVGRRDDPWYLFNAP